MFKLILQRLKGEHFQFCDYKARADFEREFEVKRSKYKSQFIF